MDSRLTVYLEKQAHLVEVQTEHLHEQREVQLSHLKLRRFTDRLKAATQVFIILVASGTGLGVLLMLYDAFTSRSVVVEAFKAPSALSSRGVTGDVVASGVLDTLQKLQDATRAVEKGLNSRGAWTSDVKIEVPETGVSIGEINRLLHERFGHDLHIDGDLMQTETGGLVLTVRGDGVPASSFTGGPGDLDKLTTEAAEYVYGRSQPYRYATFLIDAGRDKDAAAFLPGAFSRAGEDADRAKLANAWGDALIDQFLPGPAVEKHRLSMTLSPPKSAFWWRAWSNLVNDVWLVGGRGSRVAREPSLSARHGRVAETPAA